MLQLTSATRVKVPHGDSQSRFPPNPIGGIMLVMRNTARERSFSGKKVACGNSGEESLRYR
jgi:hypothetical protein